MITAKQKSAIKALFDRQPVYAGGKTPDQIAVANGWTFRYNPDDTTQAMYWEHGTYLPKYAESQSIVEAYQLAKPLTYLQFRRNVKQGYDCLMVEWAGMWLGIEPDGYVHS